MSIETELKSFNEHFGRFIKTEEEKTAAISKLADAISQVMMGSAQMRMQPVAAPVLNEAKTAEVPSAPVQAPKQKPSEPQTKEAPTEVSEPLPECPVEKEPTEEEKNSIKSSINSLCNSILPLLGGEKAKLKAIIKSFGHGDRVTDLPYQLQLKAFDFLKLKKAELEAAHA